MFDALKELETIVKNGVGACVCMFVCLFVCSMYVYVCVYVH